MKEETSGIGLLREKLAPGEVARVNAIAKRGTAALLAHAVDLDARAAAEEARLEKLAVAIDHEPARTEALIDAWLCDTATTREQLRSDRQALRRGRGSRLNIAAVGERTALRVFRLELECEITLAVLRESLRHADAADVDVDVVLALASRPGRWSRRVEALAVLRALAASIGPAVAERLADACVALADAAEHRWVQPAAVETLARLQPALAADLVRRRLARHDDPEDFLVRERFVELAGRLKGAEWQSVLHLATHDPSEHVRLTAARVDRDLARLEQTARSASSEKVRAMATVRLTKRAGAAAEPVLFGAVTGDPSPLVVRTAAAAITLLARRKTLAGRGAAMKALVAAAARHDLPEPDRALVAEELASTSVLVDPFLRIIHDLIVEVLDFTPVGGGVRIAGQAVSGLSEDKLGRVLGALARDGFSLSADHVKDGLVLYRGERRSFAPWRWLFELRHPLPSKRQGYLHTWGRKLRGRLRAPAATLAELTATNVPGERLLVERRGDWGRHVPLVDDLLHTGILSGKPTRIVGPAGMTVMTPPKAFGARLASWMTLTFGYADLVEKRRRSLESNEALVQRDFVQSVRERTGIQIDFVPHPFAEATAPPPELGLMLVPFGQAADGIVRDLLHYAVSPQGNRLPHVGAYAAAVLVAMLGRAVVIRRRIDADRRGVPLVIGGWGTRGKSGTERLKAGLVQGLGYEVLVKTTGCEAMFIHGVPGVRAQEVFIYRPYDKATIWEQRGLLRLARRFDVRVFLYECMALQPDLVNVIQAQWMRDDYSTITNAYPDHEDIQGPAGIDVAECISEFVPTNGRLFTTEDQMLPLLRERAKARGTSIREVGQREADLLGGDILARFPYNEHPKNIALVCALGQALGVPQAVTLAEMADNVVPDLGVLKTFPTVSHLGRRLAFTNGMSANERTGALSNWVRMGFDKHDPDREPERFIVTVVNNRGDRVARSEVFARFVVQDIGAHKHFLIGSNVSGLLGFIREALSRHLEQMTLSRELSPDPATRDATVEARLAAAWQRLKVGAPTGASVLAELGALGLPPFDAEAMLGPSSPEETFEESLRAVTAQLPVGLGESLPFVATSIARRRTARAVTDAVALWLGTAPARVDRVFAAAYRAMFMDSIVALPDTTLRGDPIIDLIARAAPPGSEVAIMGLQNIKGTGLDFVYRWVSLDVVDRALAKVRRPEREEEGLRELITHDDYGLLDSTHALVTLEALRDASPERAARLEPVIARLRAIVKTRTNALSAKNARSALDVLRGLVGTTFDYLDSVRRQHMADRVIEELVQGRISHAAAAIEMRAVVARAKGAWALKKG